MQRGRSCFEKVIRFRGRRPKEEREAEEEKAGCGKKCEVWLRMEDAL